MTKKQNIPSFLIICILLLLGSCNGSKSYTKRAVTLEKAGMIDEAANSYYIAVSKNRNNVDAQIGMKTLGQIVLNEKLNAFSAAQNFERPKEAVYAYLEAEEYQEKIKRIGIKLSIAEVYTNDFLKLRETYLEQVYAEGTRLLEEEAFDEADVIFTEIHTLDPSFKDVSDLKMISFAEPLYQKGIAAFKENKFREAYESFDKIEARIPNYKDTSSKRDECIEKGQLTMAIIPFENATKTPGLDTKVTAYALQSLVEMNDPFLKIVDRSNFETILEEQKLQLSGILDEKSNVNAGDLLGVQTIISGTVLSYVAAQSPVQRTNQVGYEKYKIKKLNSSDNKYYYTTAYRPVKYIEFNQTNSAEISFQYKVTSLETGEVLLSKIIKKEVKDQITYAQYNGDASSLYPSNNGSVYTNQSAKQEFDKLFTGSKTIKSTEELGSAALRQISDQMAREIASLLKIAIP